MKTVTIKLGTAWDTELWKICRRFGGHAQPENSKVTGFLTLTLLLNPPDPTFAQSGRYGFPMNGVRVNLSVPISYTSSGTFDQSSLVLTGCPCIDSVQTVPDRLLDMMNSRLHGELSAEREFPLFNSLKALEASLSNIWVDSVLACRQSSTEQVTKTAENEVGKILRHTSLDCTLISLTCQLVCMKCERPQQSRILEAAAAPVVTDCSTCTRHHSIWLDGWSIKGVDCGVGEFLGFSAWVYCACGRDFRFLDHLKPNKKLKVDFTCGCESSTFSYAFASSLSSIVSPKVRQDHQTSPRRFKEGGSLPSNGSCKHYKKSFRWLKYPCCNEWFACSQCHDARTTSHKCETEGIELMLCGFCSKEQRIANACVSCKKETNPGWSATEKMVTSDPVQRRKYRRSNRSQS